MLPQRHHGLLTSLLVTTIIPCVFAQCDWTRESVFCCKSIAPYEHYNEEVSCGLKFNNNPTLGSECTPRDAACPTGTFETCCTGQYKGWLPTCNVNVQCRYSPLPYGWSESQACAVDNPSRIFSYATITKLEDNTPAKCIAHCNSEGWRLAGVEYGDECICGSGYAPNTEIISAPPEECNMPCTGDDAQTCGDGWRIQVYVDSSQSDIPAGWGSHLACAIDDWERIIIGGPGLHELLDNSPRECIEHCSELGFEFAGVEYGHECFCGTGLREGDWGRDISECNTPCPGDKGETCGSNWRIQVYKKYSGEGQCQGYPNCQR